MDYWAESVEVLATKHRQRNSLVLCSIYKRMAESSVFVLGKDVEGLSGLQVGITLGVLSK